MRTPTSVQQQFTPLRTAQQVLWCTISETSPVVFSTRRHISVHHRSSTTVFQTRTPPPPTREQLTPLRTAQQVRLCAIGNIYDDFLIYRNLHRVQQTPRSTPRTPTRPASVVDEDTSAGSVSPLPYPIGNRRLSKNRLTPFPNTHTTHYRSPVSVAIAHAEPHADYRITATRPPHHCLSPSHAFALRQHGRVGAHAGHHTAGGWWCVQWETSSVYFSTGF